VTFGGPRQQALCSLAALAELSARDFSIGEGAWPLRGIAVLQHGTVHAYQNRCPHAGHALNLRPNEFMDPTGTWLSCRSHGALFDLSSGECVAGPCAGQALRRIPVQVVDGSVHVAPGVDLDAYLARA